MRLVGEMDADPQMVDSTRARDESIWACHLESVFGAVPLAKLRRSDIAAWVVDLADDLAPSTVTRCIVVLKKALTEAVAEGLITASPAAGVKPPRADQVERRFLTIDELNRIESTMTKRRRLVVPFANLHRTADWRAGRPEGGRPEARGQGRQGPSHRGRR